MGVADKRTTLPVRERDLVKGIVDGLRYRGRTVLVVGQWRADKAGTTAGTPDLFCWCDRRGAWIALEIKTPTGKPSAAQKALVEAGMSYLVRSIDEAFEVMGETR